MNTVEENLQIPRSDGLRDLRSSVGSPILRKFLALCLFEVADYFADRYGMSFSHACLTMAGKTSPPRDYLNEALAINASHSRRLYVPIGVGTRWASRC